MRRWRLVAVIALLVVTAGVSPAYYHFLRYVNQEGGRQIALPQKFDLAALPNRTLSYFVSEQGPAQLASGDTFGALITQIRLAARQWSDVDTSELRLQFGGMLAASAPAQSTPRIDIVFDEIPPGLIAYALPTDLIEPGPNASFVAIQRSKIVLPRDISNFASHSEAAFLTLVHEFGHALGLQHTLTSSVMSTQITRATTKARALGPDDIAGISLLYPTRTFLSSLGAISGRVTQGGGGVALASVVAISARGPAVSALTHPDGTYRIDGIPPGDYSIYVHPLPPMQPGESTPANIILPPDVQPATNFDLEFFPGVRDAGQAATVPVAAGGLIENLNFNVAPRSTPLQVYNVQTYSFPGQVAVRPALVNVNGNPARLFLAATGVGLIQTGEPTPGLRASILGNTTEVTGISVYSPGYLRFDLGFTAVSGEGVRHMVFSAGQDVYVQPGAVTLASTQPPQLDSVAFEPATNSVVLTGSNLNAETTVLFDGVSAMTRSVEESTGRLIVAAPAAAGGQSASVVALNPDGQSSLFLDPAPPAVVFEGAEAASVAVFPASLPAATEAAVEINGVNMNFVDGQVGVSFGTSDVVAKRVWVLSPTLLLVNVTVRPGTSLGSMNLAVTSGLRTAATPFAITAANPGQISMSSPNLNTVTGTIAAPAGNVIILQTAAPTNANPIVMIGDFQAAATVAAPGTMIVQIPAALPPGPAKLRLQMGGESALPLGIEIEAAQAQIVSIRDGAGVNLDAASGARAGDALTVELAGLNNISPLVRPRVTVRVGGVEHLAKLVQNSVKFTLLGAVPEGAQGLSVTIDGRTSAATSLFIRR